MDKELTEFLDEYLDFLKETDKLNEENKLIGLNALEVFLFYKLEQVVKEEIENS